MKKTLKEYYEQEKNIYEKPNKIKCFFSAVDQKLDGNKLYDWYWWHIWSNIISPFHSIRESRRQKQFDKQRIEFGVSEQDCWSIPDWLLETMYYALSNFVKAEYGSREFESIDWEEHRCNVHNKRLFKEITDYLDAYEHLQNIRDRLMIFDSGEDSAETWYPEYKDIVDKEYEVFQTCIKLLTKLLDKHLEVLWW